MTNKIYTTKEIEFLTENYPIHGAKYCAENLNRSVPSIVNKANRLNLKVAGNPNGKRVRTHEWYEEQLMLKEIDYYPVEKYEGSFSKILHACSEGHEWLVAPARLLEGTGCPFCSTSSFNYSNPCDLYYIKVTKDNETYYKIGVTGTTIKERFKSDTDKTFTVLAIRHFDTGYNALIREKELLIKYKDKRQNLKGFLKSNGSTELFEYDILGLEPTSSQVLDTL